MLTETQVRNAKPRKKTYRIYDGNGMYLEIAPSGGKWWRQKYHYADKEKRISLGINPETGLKGARVRRDDARRLLANGIDPSENRKAVRASQIESDGNSFEVVAREWFKKYSATWAQSHSKRLMRRLEKDVFLWLGAHPISEIKATELLTIIRKLENRRVLETAHRVLATCGQIFRYASSYWASRTGPIGRFTWGASSS